MSLLYYSTPSKGTGKRKRKKSTNSYDFREVNKTVFEIHVRHALNKAK